MRAWAALSADDEVRFRSARDQSNLERTRWALLGLMVVHVVDVVLFRASDGQARWRELIVLTHTVGAAATAVGILVAMLGARSARVARWLPVAMTFVVMVGTARLAAIDQLVTTSISPLIIGNLALAVLLRLWLPEAGSMHLFSALAYAWFQGEFQPDAALRLTNATNAVTFALVGAVMSFTLSAYSRRDFAQTALISRQNEALLELAQKAEAASAAKSRFLALISHELRTPLNGVIGLTQLLEAAPLGAEERRLVSAMARAGDSLVTIINDLLDFSKIEAGKLTLEQRPFEVRKLIADLVALHSGQAIERALTLDSRVDGAPSVWVLGDETRLRQVLSNLISNALKFTERGGVSVTAKATVEAGQARLVVHVVDTGIGITEAQQTRLFEPFEQADRSTTRRFGGTGLGLAICRQLIGLMGGRVELERSTSEGSSFVVEVQLAACAAPVGDLSTGAHRFHGRALVADDNAVNVLVAKELLKRLGLEVLTATDGQEALEVLDHEQVDVVFTDLQMPRLDGYELTRRLRELGSRVPVIAISGSTMQEDRERCLAAGMTDTIAKPVHQRDLERVMRQLQG